MPPEWLTFFKVVMPCADKDIEQLDLSYITGGSINCHNFHILENYIVISTKVEHMHTL